MITRSMRRSAHKPSLPQWAKQRIAQAFNAIRFQKQLPQRGYEIETLEPRVMLTGNVETFQGHDYVLTGNHYTFEQAQQKAERLGGHLVAINSQAEQDFLEQEFGHQDCAFYIGANDRAHEGQFEWTNDDEFDYENFANGQPNDWRGEDAVVMNRNGAWYDVDRRRRFRALIEIPGRPPEALNDHFVITGEQDVLLNVLENDKSSDGSSLNIVAVEGAENGTVSIVDNKVLYSPASDTVANDRFTYTIEDASGKRDTATVTMFFREHDCEDSLVINGSFEHFNFVHENDLNHKKWHSHYSNWHRAASLLGWSTTSGEAVEIVRGYGPSEGKTFIDLNAKRWQQDDIFQDVETREGEEYLLTFDMKEFHRSAAVEVYWGDELVGTFNNDRHWAWVEHSVRVTADMDGLTRLSFKEVGNHKNKSIFLDDIKLLRIGDNLVENGSFESRGSHGDPVPGWNVENHHSRRISNRWFRASDRYHSLRLSPSKYHDQGISQDIATTPGQEYLIQFDLRKHHSSDVKVFWEGELVGRFSANSRWDSKAIKVTAGDTGSSELRFVAVRDQHHSNYWHKHWHRHTRKGPYIDDVSVHALDCDPVGQQPLEVEPIPNQNVDEQTPFTYQVVANSNATSIPNIDFELGSDAAPLSSGDIVTDQFAGIGVHVTTSDPINHPAMIFDSANPTGGDHDLGTPNATFGGPGIGNGGQSGFGANNVARQNILIISEDADSSDPDDNRHGGTLIFTFDDPVMLDDIGLLDIEAGEATIQLYDSAGNQIADVTVPGRGNNNHQIFALNATGVSRMEVTLGGSGAVTDLIFCRDGCSTGGGPLTYALAAGAPTNMTISDTGLIEWTPTEEQGPGVYEITVEVSDGSQTAMQTFEIVVNEVNRAPLVDPIGNQSVAEQTPFSLQAIATDPDIPLNTLTFSLGAGAPAGVMISAAGLIEWTPTEQQGPGVYEITVQVSDGDLSDTETFEITVGEVNRAPVVETIDDQTTDELAAFEYQVVATDPDLPTNTLTYALGTNTPTGLTISPSGLIEWTPTEAQGPGTYAVDIDVSDGELTATASFMITVAEVNVAPVIAAIDDQTTNENSPYGYQVIASDADLPANTLTYNLVSPPNGMTISSDGLIEWTPGERQGPDVYDIVVEVSDGTATVSETYELTVNEVNRAPVVRPIADQNVDEETEFSYQVDAVDNDFPRNALTYGLGDGAPAGMTISPTGLIEWTPTEAQGPGAYPVTAEVSDGTITRSRTFMITVGEVNRAPLVQAIDDQTIDERTMFEYQVVATDPDIPINTLTISLEGDIPDGMTIDDDGLIKWIAAESQGPDVYTITVQATDDGTPMLFDVETFDLTVLEVNRAPRITPIADINVADNSPINFTVEALDPDLPLNNLVYSFDEAPVGATIDPDTGEIGFTPAGNGTFDFTVRVTDDGSPSLFDTESFRVIGEDCLFGEGEWMFGESGGGSNPGGGSVAGCDIVLVEGDSFEVSASVNFTVPDEQSHFIFNYSDLNFDDSDNNGFVNDAFEVAIVDADGNSLVHSIEPGRDAFFNVSEAAFEQAGINAEVNGNEIKIDLSYIPDGTEATIIFRLVNNDADEATTVRVTPVAIMAGSLGTSRGLALPATVEAPPINLADFDDVTPSVEIQYRNSSYNAATGSYFANLDLRNLANYPIDGPFLLVVKNVSATNVNVADADGFTDAGDPYYVVNDSEIAADGTLQTGATSQVNSLEFNNPSGRQFTYEVQILASPNDAPTITSTPNTLVEAGRPYVYDANATDPNGDTLSYELLSSPGGMTIDPDTGLINWSPQTADLGNNLVNIKVSDGRGAFDEQQFVIEVRDEVPNRPPVIITSPVTQAFVATEETQEIGNLVVNGDFENGNTGFTSDYTNTPGNIANAGTYAVTTNPRSVQSLATSYGDFTTGSGNMLAVNGSTTPGEIVWEQTVDVTPGRTYDFAAAISSWFPAAPAALLFTVNGEDIGALNAPDQTAEWVQLFATWDSGNSTSATIRVVNGNDAFTGNDFALDDIYFGGPRFSNPSYQYPVKAIDADADPITYSLDQAPEGMSIDPDTGLIVWNPSADQLGTHTVVVIADDGRGGTATQEYEVVVLSDEGNSAPVIISDPVDSFFIPGFSNPASGDVTPQRISLDLGNGETFDGTVSITLPEEAGRFADIVISVDESASMGGDQDWIPDMIPLLDQALKDAGIGATPENPNRFAIVGGGRQNLVSYFFSQQPNTKYTLYGPNNEVVAEGMIDEVLPDELLNLQFEDDGRYVLVVEAENAADLAGGIDIGIEGEIGDGVRVEQLQLNTLVSDDFLLPGQPVEYQFSLGADTLLYFDSQTKDVYSTITWSLDGPSGQLANNVWFQISDISDTTPTYPAVAGDYTLTIDSTYDTASDYKFQLIDLAAGTPIDSGETVTDEFETKVGTHAYRFSAEQGQLFAFDNSTTGVHSGSKWRLISQTGEVLISRAIGTNQAPFELPYSGQYFLLMEAALWPQEGTSQLRQPSTFEFTAEFGDPPIPTPINLGDTVNGTIDYIGDFVEYSFTLAERSNLYMDSLVDRSITWQLTGPAGSTTPSFFSTSDSFNQANPVANFVAGDYVLRVSGISAEGAFAFRPVDLASATPITPGTEFSGELTVPNETDFYKFNASAGDEFFVDVVATSDSVNTLYRIYDQYGREVGESGRLVDLTSLTTPVDGEYTLAIEGWKNNLDQDTYTINIVPIVQTTRALTLGSVTNDSLSTPGERVEYTFSLASDTQLYFDSLTNDPNIVWSLEGPRGVEVDALRIDRSDSFDRADASIDALAGDWRLTVRANGDATGDFSFALLDLLNSAHVTQITPNPGAGNSPVTITPTAGLDPKQTEVFRFTAVAGDEFSFVTSVTGSNSSIYRIVELNGAEVTPRTAIATDRLNQVMPRSGDYLLLVEPRYNNTDVDEHSIDINFVQNNGPTSFAGAPLILGATTSGNLSTAGQVDAYTFTLSNRSVTYFDSLTNSGAVRWNLTGPTGVIVSNRAFSASDSFNLSDVTADLLPGDYLLEVFASSGTPGDYSFRTHDVATATPITPGTPFSNTLDPANETDLYKFDANAGETFYFDVEAASDVTNTQYKLIDPFGRRIFTSNRLNDFGPQQVDFDGTYTLLVEAWRGNTGTDTYTMNVHRVPNAVETPLVIGAVNSGSFPTPGETAKFTFSLNDFTQIHFDSLTNSSIYNWTLTNSAGTIVSALRFDRTDSTNGTNNYFELAPDDYTLTVAGVGETQDYAFRLLDVAANSTTITTDTQITSVHTNTKSTNIFELDFQAGDRALFDFVSATGFTTAGRWRLFDAFGNELFDASAATDVGPITIERTGIHRLVIEGSYQDTGADGEYLFEVVSLGNELNPTPATPLVLGDVVNGDVDKRFETDRYAFTLAEDSLTYFDSLTNDSSLNWTLSNQSGTFVSPRAFNSGTTSLLRLPAGDYELSITSNTIEPYSFAFYDLATSPTIVPGTPQAGELATANETDIYQFSGLAGDEVYLDVVSVGSAGRATVSVVNELGVVISSSTSFVDQDTFTLPNDGQYFVLVEGRINQTIATTYEINVVLTNTASAALTLGATQSAAIDTIGQSIEYSFNLPAQASLYFDSLTDTSEILWTLESTAGTVVTNRRFNTSDSFNFETPLLKLLAAGDYTLTVTGSGDAVGNFSFRLVDVASGMMVTPGTPVSGELTIPNETDVYQFDGTAGDQILVDWLAADDTNNSLYRVYDPLGNELFELRDLLDGDLPTLPFTGTYTLLVEGWRGNTGLDTYQFNLVSSANRTVAMNIGDKVNQTLAIGETVEFTFDAANDMFVHFDSLTNQSRLTWSLTGPTGEIITNRRFNDSDSVDETDTVFELRQGSYRLTVNGSTDFTGDFGFSLFDVSTAAAITPGIVTGELNPGIETQLYKFDANAGDNFTFDSISADNNRAYYRVVDPFGQTVFTRVLTGDQNNVDLAVTGTYTLLVEGRHNATVPNAYEIDVIFNGNTPPPALTGDALTLGVTQNGDLNTAGQIDSYQFSLTDRSLLHMDVLTNNGTFRWTLRGPRGIEVSNRAFTSTDSFDSNTSNMDLFAGDYQLEIFASSGSPGVYGFTLHNLADAIAITPGTAFPAAPNDTLGPETDLYQFNAIKGDRFLIDVVSASQTNNAELKVIDEYGIVIALQNSLTDRDQLVIPRDGTYTLLVEGDQDNQAVDTYSINIVPIVTATFALNTGVASSGTLQAGQEHEYTLSLTDASLLLFTPQTISNQVEWTLTNDVGTSLVDSRDFDDGILPIDLLAGDYTLTVDGVNDYTGETNFTAVIADSSSQLGFGEISNTQLTASNSVAVYQFNGVAGQHFALRPDFNLVFDDAATSALTAEDLSTSFDNEDQHAGIDVALRNDVFRDGAAINFITVSDEDRDILDDNVNFETIFTDLSERGALLNAIVSSTFRDENNANAIGVDSEGNAYLADGSGGFTVSPGGFDATNNISIRQDYIDLAWALDGAAWDLRQLRVGGVTAESFTNAFVDVKVAEILEQTSLRLVSSDPNADFTISDPVGGVYDDINPLQEYEFDIQIGNDGTPRSFDLLFKQGRTVGSIPVFIASPYQYGASAVDADGDTLTWSIVEGPDGLAIDSDTGVLSWGVDGVIYGLHDVTIRVDDGRGGFDEQSFVLDVNGGEAASISGLVVEGDDTFTVGREAFAVNPYLSLLDSPLNTNDSFVIEDFEDGTFDLEGVSLSAGNLTSRSLPGLIDSVDGDDGAIDGSGSTGESWFYSAGSIGITITFDQNILGEFPTQAGVAWTDGDGPITFRAFDGNGVLIQEFNDRVAGVGFLGQTDEDVFFGAQSIDGISSIFIANASGGIEIDHIQYSLAPLPVGQPDFTVYLDQNRNGVRDANEQSTVTDAGGRYAFENIAAGSYVVALEPMAGWETQFPASGIFEVSVDFNENLRGLNFANKPVPIVNSKPRITSSPALDLVAGEQFSYLPTIEELDGDDLTFDLPLGPAGMAVNPETGKLVWDTTLDDIGPNNVLLRVKDGRGGFDLQYFTINVAKPNSAPTITSTAPVGPAGVGLPYQYNVDAFDIDDDTLTFSLTDAPNGATIDATTGVIDWTPTSGQLGSQDFVVNVDDGRGLSSAQSFSINVVIDPPNVDPEFLTVPPLEAHLGDAYIYRVIASDANGDPLVIALDAAPAGMSIDADGLITWTPTPAQIGNNLVRISADDGRGGIAIQEYTILVNTQPVNQPPQITSPPRTTAVAGQTYSFQPTAVDPNNDTLTWELVEGPTGMSINPTTGELSWSPTTGDIGSEQVVIRVLDTYAAFSELGYTLNVRAVNTPPAITSAPITTAAVGATYIYQVNANDSDGDQLTFSLITAPTGATIDPVSGLIQWTPISGQEGTNDIELRVDDGNGGFATQSFSIVTAAGVNNQLPTIVSTPGFFAGVGDLYTYDVNATDPENETLTYTLLQSPTGMTIDSASGLIEWTPTIGDLGTTIVRIVARDPAGAGSIQEYSLTVREANNIPVINSEPPTGIPSGGTYRYDVLASDVDNEFLTYELINAPAGMLIDGLGRIFWQPTAGQVGANAVEILVSDPRGGTATQSFDITVVADTTDPQVAILLSANPVNIGDSVDIRVSAIDNVGIETLALTLDGTPVALDSNGNARVEMTTVGSFTAIATATDAAGNSSTDTIQIFVADPNDVEGPVVSITSPGDGDLITAPTDVIGSVTDDTLVSYRLLLAEFGSTDFQVIGSGTENVTNDVLGRIDPTLLQNNSYVLRLEAFDAGGNGNVIEQAVEITGDLKVGNYSLTFNDLSVNVGSIPINIYRTYDSLTSNDSDDFGFGWSLNVWDTDLAVDLPSSGLERYGVYTPFAIGTRVYVTQPDGTRDGFTFDPTLRTLPGFGNNLTLASPRFTPDPGVTSTLSVGGGQLFINQFGELTAGGGIPWNPASPDFGGGYTLTIKDGTRLRIDGETGQVKRVTDRNGNQLTLTAAGISSSDGAVVAFERGTEGRITAITDGNGNKASYAYDANGDLVSYTDRDGNETTYEYSPTRAHFLDLIVDPLGRTGQRADYDDDGRVTTVLNGRGDGVTVTYDLDSNLLTRTDALGNPTTTVYDNRGNITALVDALGGTTSFEYDDDSNLTRRTDALGNSTTYTYDARGNVLSTTNELGFETLMSYNSSGDVTSVTDPLGNTVTSQYDGNGNLTRRTDQVGGETIFSYDSSGNLVSNTDATGDVTEFVYVGGVLTSVTDADGVMLSLETDGNGAVTAEDRTITDSTGRTVDVGWEYDYTAGGRLTRTIGSNGITSEQILNAAGEVTSVVRADGSTQTSTYDLVGNIDSLTFDSETTATFEYDALGRRTKATLSNGLTVDTTYDALGRETSRSYSNGQSITRVYDAVGNVLSETDESGSVTQYQYDALYRLVSLTLPNGTATEYSYDATGRRTAVALSGSSLSSIQYDEKGRVTSETFASGETETYEYDGDDNVTRFVERTGAEWQFEYSSTNVITKIIDPDGNVTSYGVDAAGAIDAITDALERTTRFTLNELGLQTSRTLPMGQVDATTYSAGGVVQDYTDFNGDLTAYAYDSLGRISTIMFNGQVLQTNDYTVENTVTSTDSRGDTTIVRDADSLLNSFVSPLGFSVNWQWVNGEIRGIASEFGSTALDTNSVGQITEVTGIDGNVTNLEYDSSGFPTAVEYEDGSRIERTYDSFGRTLTIQHLDSDENVTLNWSYTRLSDGRIESIDKGAGHTESYVYDNLGRLAQTTINKGSTSTVYQYSYDAVGNMTERTIDGQTESYTVDANDRLINAGDWDYTYDANGNVIERTDGVTTESYDYDEAGRMVRFTRTGSDPVVVEYEYDVDGLLAVRRENGAEKRYVWDRAAGAFAMLLEVRNENNELIVRYEHNGAVHTRAIFANGETYQIITDHLGSVVGLISSSTGLLQTLEYDAFGNELTPALLDLGFGGGFGDSDSGLLYLRNRWYDPSVARFTQADPANADFRDVRTLNRYAYTTNDPINNNDPNGTLTLKSQLIAAGIIGTLAAIVVVAPEAVINTVFRVFTGGDRVRFENKTADSFPYLEFDLGLKKFPLFSVSPGFETLQFTGGETPGIIGQYTYIGGFVGLDIDLNNLPKSDAIGGTIKAKLRPAQGEVFDTRNAFDYQGAFLSVSAGASIGIQGKILGFNVAQSFGYVRQISFSPSQTYFDHELNEPRYSHSRTDFKGGTTIGFTVGAPGSGKSSFGKVNVKAGFGFSLYFLSDFYYNNI